MTDIVNGADDTGVLAVVKYWLLADEKLAAIILRCAPDFDGDEFGIASHSV